MSFEQINKFFFDLDHTLWNWDETILGAEDLIHTIQDQGKEVYYHTDNSMLSRDAYAKKLNQMDLPASKEQILTVNYVAAKHFKRKGIHSVYAIGESGLHQELENNGIRVSQNANHVLLGLDRQFSYNKLRRAKNILEDGGKLFICSTEKTLRKSSRTVPHQLAMNNALKTFSSDTKLLGKPSSEFVNTFSSYFGYMPERSLFIGDRLADIEIGNKLGMKTALVMSGETSKSDLKNAENIQKPDFGVGNLSKLSRKLNSSKKPF